MALPQKHTVTANLQVRGGATRIVALENAVRLRIASGNRSTSDVLETADEFVAWLERDQDSAGEGEPDEQGDR